MLQVTQAPPTKTAIFVQGAPILEAPFRDCLLGAGSPLVRLQLLTTDASGTATTTVSIATIGAAAPGATRNYPAWFRDPSGPCGVGSNVSAALRIVWQ